MTPRNAALPLLFVLSALHALSASAANESSLPRRGYLGAALDIEGEAAERGIRVREVLPDSSAQAAGLLPEDVVLRLDGRSIEGPDRLAAAVQTIRRARAGQTLDATILRQDAERSLRVTLLEFPRESAPDYETLYDSIDVDGLLHRVIVTLPRGSGPHPAMVFLQGLYCGSVEAPLQPLDPVRQLIAGVTRDGFATVRVEKSGCGDSQGPPCEEIDFKTELKAYRAVVDYTMKRERIDASRIFVFGHSMGGVFAPLIATERRLAGVIVYGAIGVDLPHYFRDNDARQLPMMGYTGPVLETQLDYSEESIRLIFGERLSPGQAMERDPRLRGFLRLRQGDDTHLFGRHYAFWHQLDELNLPEPWTRVDVPVLALWGSSDVAATRSDHPLIADTVNALHPGLAEFRELAGTGHGFELSPSMADSMRNGMQGEFNPLLVSTCVDWMKRSAGAR